jgi:hypothetical protein
MNRDKGGPGPGGRSPVGVHLVSVSVCTKLNGYELRIWSYQCEKRKALLHKWLRRRVSKGFKIQCPQGRVGSSPTFGTRKLIP